MLGYVNAAGQSSSRIVEPLAVEGGYLSAYDHRSEERRTFALHRITEVGDLDDAD
jgi:predicted DNA-binding transcriptional regulator YafY